MKSDRPTGMEWLVVVLGCLLAGALAVLVGAGLGDPAWFLYPVIVAVAFLFCVLGFMLIARVRKMFVPGLIRKLTERDPAARERAARRLGQLGELAAPAIGALAEALGDTDVTVRLSVAEALTQIVSRTTGTEAMPALIAATRDPDERVRLAAIKALHPLDPKVEGAPAFIAAARDPDERVRLAAVEALSSLAAIKVFHTAVVPALTGALGDTSAKVHACAAQALGWFDELAAPAVPALIPALEDQDQDVRLNTVVALGKIGPAAREAIPALERFSGEDSTAGLLASDALREIRGGETEEQTADSG